MQKFFYLKVYLFGILFSFALPIFLYAQKKYSQDLFGVFEYIKDIFNDIVLWLITTGAVTIFIAYITYQLFKVIKQGKVDPNFKKYLFYGLVALTIMFTFYAAASLIAITFGIEIVIPQFYQDQTGLSPGSGRIPRTRSLIE